MIGLSQDIEESIQNSLEGLMLDVSMLSVDDVKLSALVKSRIDSFTAIKQMLVTWQNSPNAPSHEKLKTYIIELVQAGEVSVEILREALKKKINFADLEPEKYGSAISSKPIILKAISDIDAGNKELKLQIEVDKFDLGERDFKRGFPEKYANQEFYPLKNYYKEWLDDETQSIMICPKGTKGEVIVLDGLKIMLPKKPKNTDIMFHRKPKSEQYWVRPEMPKGLTPDTEEAFTDYILEEYRRRREGVWFMNNGEAVYLTPAHYMGLMWNEMLETGGYKEFRMAQANMYYHAKACLCDPRSVGMLFVKGRRTGFTEMVLDHLVDSSTSTKNAKYGITSKTENDAISVYLKYSHVIQNLPFFFIPVVKGKIDDVKKMVFGKPSDNSKANKKLKDTSTKDYLNTMVDYRATATLAYDSIKLTMYLGDECFDGETEILMSDFNFKKIKDIKVGEKVIVEGGKEIIVADKIEGYDEMYKITQPYGKDYIVNSQHNLYLERRNASKRNGYDLIKPVDYLESNYYTRRTYCRVLSKGFEFKEKELPIDPYIFGLWLGDGYSKSPQFIVNYIEDPEIYGAIIEYSKINNFIITESERTDIYTKIRLSDKTIFGSNQITGSQHRLVKILKELNVWGNKRIPNIYLNSSKEQRLQLLSGIIDSDGHYTGRSYTIGMSRKDLVEDIYYLCKLTGIDVSEVSEKMTNFNTKSYKINISKNTDLKCLVKRKQCDKTTFYKSRRLKMDVESIGEGKFYGIKLATENQDDRRLILKDFTLSMNCGKWERPNNYEDHWSNIKPTMVQGGKVVGKAFIGSTLNPKDKGGSQFETLDKGSNVLKRNANDRTITGLYSYFLPAHFNMEDYTDKFGVCHTTVASGDFFINASGVKQKIGSLQYLENEFASAKLLGDKFYWNARRLDPITKQDAFRDEAVDSSFDQQKLNDQLDYNYDYDIKKTLVRGNFSWENGAKDTKVIWTPNERGRFLLAWLPEKDMQNKFEMRRNQWGGMSYHPMNDDIGCLGADNYDMNATNESVLENTENGLEHSGGSRGALSGVTGVTMKNIPSNFFFLEYLTRPEEAEIFYEDALMACVFYGMPILIENNKPRMLHHFKNRGYRGFSLTRFDKLANRLSPDEKLLGGIPSSSQDIITSHATGIESYILKFVGKYNQGQSTVAIREEGEIGSMPFERTLKDWSKFNISKREKFDITVASGYALMGLNRKSFTPKEKEKAPIVMKLQRFTYN